MASYAIKRILTLIPTLLVLATIVFFLVRYAPGGPFDAERRIPPEVLAQIEAKYHLDWPILKQYVHWLWDVVSRGDLGPTFKYPNRTVNEIIGLSLPVSMKLGTLAFLFAVCFGIPLGVIAASRHNTFVDTLVSTVSMVGVSVPRFVLGPLLILVFALNLYLLPVARWESARHMILPVICAGLPVMAYVVRLTRAGMLEVTRSDFLRTARAKGLSERKVLMRHALRGGLLPVVSFLGPGFSGLLVGSLVVEKLFNIPGMGRYFVEAALNRDYNLVSGITLVYGLILMLANTLVDIAYAWLDPRVELR